MPSIAAPGVPDMSLTDREIQVLAYQTCLPQPSISQELGMSPSAVQRHISEISRKLTSEQDQVAARDTPDDDFGWPFL